jgi:hypothetical protein
MMLIPLSKFRVKAHKIGEVMCHDRPPLGGRESKMLFIGNSAISFRQRMGGIISSLIKGGRQMQMDIFVEIDLDA